MPSATHNLDTRPLLISLQRLLFVFGDACAVEVEDRAMFMTTYAIIMSRKSTRVGCCSILPLPLVARHPLTSRFVFCLPWVLCADASLRVAQNCSYPRSPLGFAELGRKTCFDIHFTVCGGGAGGRDSTRAGCRKYLLGVCG